MPYRMKIRVISARKLVRDCRKFEECKKKIPGETLVLLLPDHQFHFIIVGKRVIFHRSVEENVEIKEGEGMADRWRRWPNPWQ